MKRFYTHLFLGCCVDNITLFTVRVRADNEHDPYFSRKCMVGFPCAPWSITQVGGAERSSVLLKWFTMYVPQKAEETDILTEKMYRISQQSAFLSQQCNISGDLHQPARYGDKCLKWYTCLSVYHPLYLLPPDLLLFCLLFLQVCFT